MNAAIIVVIFRAILSTIVFSYPDEVAGDTSDTTFESASELYEDKGMPAQ